MESLITIDQANPFIGIDQILLSDIEMARVNATLLAMVADGVSVTMDDQTTLFIPLAETQHLEGKQVGDTIALVTNNHSTYRVDAEATNEEILLLLKHYYNGDKLRGVVQSRKHNGLIVKINNTDAFLPINQIEIENQHNLDRLIGEELEFRLLSLKVKLKELSRFIPILSLLNVQKLDELDAYRRFARAHAINDVVSGVVTSMSKYGVFVTLESYILGFFHISYFS